MSVADAPASTLPDQGFDFQVFSECITSAAITFGVGEVVPIDGSVEACLPAWAREPGMADQAPVAYVAQRGGGKPVKIKYWQDREGDGLSQPAPLPLYLSPTPARQFLP